MVLIKHSFACYRIGWASIDYEYIHSYTYRAILNINRFLHFSILFGNIGMMPHASFLTICCILWHGILAAARRPCRIESRVSSSLNDRIIFLVVYIHTNNHNNHCLIFIDVVVRTMDTRTNPLLNSLSDALALWLFFFPSFFATSVLTARQ